MFGLIFSKKHFFERLKNNKIYILENSLKYPKTPQNSPKFTWLGSQIDEFEVVFDCTFMSYDFSSNIWNLLLLGSY
jgi:hypothetical protein